LTTTELAAPRGGARTSGEGRGGGTRASGEGGRVARASGERKAEGGTPRAGAARISFDNGLPGGGGASGGAKKGTPKAKGNGAAKKIAGKKGEAIEMV